jgi:hypothetical protein
MVSLVRTHHHHHHTQQLKIFQELPPPKENAPLEKRVLIVGTSPCPPGLSPLGVGLEHNHIAATLSKCGIKWTSLVGKIVFSELFDKIAKFRPTIVYYCGFGVRDNLVLFDEKKEEKKLVPFKLLNGALTGVEGLILSCEASVGNHLRDLSSPQWIIGYSAQPGDRDSLKVSKRFFQQLSSGIDPREAFNRAKALLDNNFETKCAPLFSSKAERPV